MDQFEPHVTTTRSDTGEILKIITEYPTETRTIKVTFLDDGSELHVDTTQSYKTTSYTKLSEKTLGELVMGGGTARKNNRQSGIRARQPNTHKVTLNYCL